MKNMIVQVKNPGRQYTTYADFWNYISRGKDYPPYKINEDLKASDEKYIVLDYGKHLTNSEQTICVISDGVHSYLIEPEGLKFLCYDLESKFNIDTRRRAELKEAITEHLKHNLSVPREWVDEYNSYVPE